MEAGIGSQEGSSYGFHHFSLRATPDGKILFAAEVGLSPCALYRFDISAATAKLLQSTKSSGDGSALSVSHDSRSVILSGGAGTFGHYGAVLLSATDIEEQYGGFEGNSDSADFAYPGPFAFGANDGTVFQFAYGSTIQLRVFNIFLISMVSVIGGGA